MELLELNLAALVEMLENKGFSVKLELIPPKEEPRVRKNCHQVRLRRCVEELRELLESLEIEDSSRIFDLMAQKGFGKTIVYEAGKRLKTVKKVCFARGRKTWTWSLGVES